MTMGYTDEEWLAIIDQAEQDLPLTPPVYRAPHVGSETFAKTIDHTLLKLDATEEQIDVLCEEARRFNFKACLFSMCMVH
jgi:deoxyribose-phosphate aldolase